jgi:hypothetical protein
MSESDRLTGVVLAIIGRLRRQGSSTKVLWIAFSGGNSLSRSEFDRNISQFGLPLRPGDLDIIWANIGIKGSVMSYSDFVRFITLNSIDASILGQPVRMENVPQENTILAKTQTVSLLDILLSHKSAIVSAMLSLGPTCSGYISTSDLESILRRFAAVGPDEVQPLTAPYDTHQ